jgi:hypothetical protein
MMKLVEYFLKLMPVWFGIGFLGPVMAELYLRTPLHSFSGLSVESSTVYLTCMLAGAAYGLVAFITGRWI